MKVTLEIPEEEILEMAKRIAAERLADAMRDRYYEARSLDRSIKEVIRESIKPNMDTLADRAVSAAAKSIENRAVKKLLDKLKEEE